MSCLLRSWAVLWRTQYAKHFHCSKNMCFLWVQTVNYLCMETKTKCTPLRQQNLHLSGCRWTVLIIGHIGSSLIWLTFSQLLILWLQVWRHCYDDKWDIVFWVCFSKDFFKLSRSILRNIFLLYIQEVPQAYVLVHHMLCSNGSIYFKITAEYYCVNV